MGVRPHRVGVPRLSGRPEATELLRLLGQDREPPVELADAGARAQPVRHGAKVAGRALPPPAARVQEVVQRLLVYRHRDASLVPAVRDAAVPGRAEPPETAPAGEPCEEWDAARTAREGRSEGARERGREEATAAVGGRDASLLPQGSHGPDRGPGRAGSRPGVARGVEGGRPERRQPKLKAWGSETRNGSARGRGFACRGRRDGSRLGRVRTSVDPERLVESTSFIERMGYLTRQT